MGHYAVLMIMIHALSRCLRQFRHWALAIGWRGPVADGLVGWLVGEVFGWLVWFGFVWLDFLYRFGLLDLVGCFISWLGQ